jgi:hypothetical protein
MPSGQDSHTPGSVEGPTDPGAPASDAVGAPTTSRFWLQSFPARSAAVIQYALIAYSPTITQSNTMAGRGKGKSSGKKAMSKSSKAGLQFPVGRIARYLKKGRYAGKPVVLFRL